MKLVIFDLDGTLVNSLEDLADATNYSLEKYNFPKHELEKFKYFVGDGVPKLIERALPENHKDEAIITMVKATFDEYYHSHYADKTKPYNEITELLNELKRRGYLLAVASNKPDEFTKAIVKTFFNGIFDVIQGKTSDTKKKPAPDIVLKIMKNLDVANEDTIMIGDTNVDIFTAKNADVKSIGCLWGFRTRAELEEAKADYIAEKPSDILNFI